MDASRLRGIRRALADHLERTMGPFDPLHREALVEVPRERFVRPEDVARSADDMPLTLDASGLATISAPHAYLLSFRLLELAPGDHLVELGTGSGYGAALGAYVVGARGSVRSFEFDAELAAWARANHTNPRAYGGDVTVVHGDAVTSAGSWGGFDKVVCTFAVEALPGAWLTALRPSSVGVAPVGPRQEQKLVRFAREAAGAGGRLVTSEHGAVRYVPNRSAIALEKSAIRKIC